MLFVVRCVFVVACCLSFVVWWLVRVLLSSVWFLMVAVCCSLGVVRSLLFVVWCASCAVHSGLCVASCAVCCVVCCCLLFVCSVLNGWSFPVVWCVMFVVRLPFVVCCSLFGVGCVLFVVCCVYCVLRSLCLVCSVR